MWTNKREMGLGTQLRPQTGVLTDVWKHTSFSSLEKTELLEAMRASRSAVCVVQ